MFNYVLHTVSELSAETRMFLEKQMVGNNSFMRNDVHYRLNNSILQDIPGDRRIHYTPPLKSSLKTILIFSYNLSLDPEVVTSS